MASGKTHDQITCVLLIPVILLCHHGFGIALGKSVMIGAGMWFGGLFLSPDLDIKSKPFYRWGPFRFIWWPYQWAIRHRGNDSHGLVLAPLFRLVYLSAVCILAYLAIVKLLMLSLASSANSASAVNLDGSARQQVLDFFRQYRQELVLLGIGVWLGSLLHTALDWLSSLLQRR